MKLRKLLADVSSCRQLSGGDPEVSSIEYDSRKIFPGSLFVALRGLRVSGETFIDDAVRRGAVAIVSESGSLSSSSAAIVRTENARKALAQLSWAYYGHPEKQLVIVGATGTNGKTTTTSLIQLGLNRWGWKSGLIGTLGVFHGDVSVDSPRTTPESADLARYFAEMIRAGCSHVVMEATSIGIDLERTHGIPFRVAVFTNLTRDHLDYHGSEEAYRDAKLRLFSEMDSSGTAIINRDDPASEHFIRASRGNILTYGLSEKADLQATQLQLDRGFSEFLLRFSGQSHRVRTSLVGEFNVYNVLAAIGALQALGIPLNRATTLFTDISPVKGRAEQIRSSAPFTVIVDYAHTPDALEKILTTLSRVPHRRLITVIGAGGDRDRGKRPLMASTAFRLSDLLVLTSDNPRTEHPEMILDDMCEGLPSNASFTREADRKAAIMLAISDAGEHDIVLIAGKGHESYQEIQGVRYPFDDAAVARECLRRRGFDT